jgi:hypothetical protein
MGRSTKWGIQPHVSNLYWLTKKELVSIYPNYTQGTLAGKKAYWTKKIKEGKMPVPPKAEKEPEILSGQIPDGRLVKTWEVSAFDRETNEWTTTTNSSYEHSPNAEDLAEVFEPATAARITPTKRKRAETIGKQILVFGDSQIGYHRVYDQEGNDELVPTHSEATLSVLAQINAHERPDTVVNVSDTVDLAEFGRFDPQSDSFHRTLGPAFQRAHDLYAQLRSDNPDARMVEVDSNHTTRVHKNLMKKMPEMYGFTLPGEDYPLMSYYRLANLAPLDVEFIPGYGAAEFVYGEEYSDKAPIIFKHGTTTASAPGAVVRKESIQEPNHHVVRGHGHSYEAIAQTTRTGEQLRYIQLGTTCMTSGQVPSYGSAMDDHGHPVHKQENWQNQLLMIEDFDGHYNFNVIDVADGIAYFRGRQYDGNE